MDAKWLDDFLAVAQCRSFTRAAQLRSTSQSGLSRRIQSLEHWVGATLVDRDARPFRLTEAGMRFVPLATHLRGALVAARQLCATQASVPVTTVKLAVAEGVESGVLPTLLTRLKEQGFDAPICVAVKGIASASEALLTGDADLWLAPQHAHLPLPLDPHAFDAVTVAHDRLLPIVGVFNGRPLHTLPGTREQPAPLLEHGIAGPFAQLIGMLLSTVPQRAHLRSVCAADSLHSLRALVRQGLGVAFLPESMVRDDLRRGELAHADMRWSAALEIRLVRASRPAAPLSEAAQALWKGLAWRDGDASVQRFHAVARRADMERSLTASA